MVNRADGSGTTYISVTREWLDRSRIRRDVELAYAIQSKMPTALVKNQAGKFIESTIETTTAAAAAAAKNMPGAFRVSITDAPGADAYPIASFTWLLVWALVKFLWWAIHEG